MSMSQADLTQLDPAEDADTIAAEVEKLLSKAEDETEVTDEPEETEAEIEPEETEDEAPEETPVDPDAWKSQEFEVNGEKVSGAELASGYMKDADYRQKTAQAAQLRRDAEHKLEYVNSELSQKATRLDVLANALYQEIAGDQSQLQSLVESDPAEYLRRSHYLAQRNQLLQQAMAEREEVGRLQDQTRGRQLAEYAAQEQEKLVQVMPEWRDKKVAETEQRELAEYLISKGYEPAELSELYDHRALVLAKKAMLYDKRASLKPTVAKGASLAPGAPQPKTQPSKQREALSARALRTGNRDDLAAAISQYIT